jgi:hypothetical protein
MIAPSENLPKDQPSIPQSGEEVEVFEKETFPDQILLVDESEERQMLVAGQPKCELTGSYAITEPRLGNTWLTKAVDFLRLGWKRAIGTISVILRFIERLRHRVHSRRHEICEHCTGCMLDPEQGLAPLVHQLVMTAASQQVSAAEGRQKLETEYHRDGEIWYSARRLEKEGEPELRDVDGLPFFDALSIKKVLPIVHIQSSIFQSYLSYVHDRLLDHPGVEQTLKGIRECMMPVGGNVRAKIAAYRRACTKCRRRLKDRIQKEVGDYPKSRSTVAPPFYHVMLGIATGFRGKPTKNSREYVAVYALVMVCMTTSATSILALEALSTTAVIRSYFGSFYSSLVVEVFTQLLSELRKGLSEAGVWDLFNTIRPSTPDDLHGGISCSVPMIVGPRSRYHLQHLYRPPGVPLSFLKKRSLTHAFFIPPRGECEGYRRPGSKQRFFFFIIRYEK